MVTDSTGSDTMPDNRTMPDMPDNRIMPNMSGVALALARHDAFAAQCWKDIDALLEGVGKNANAKTLAIMEKMSESAKGVGRAFYEATQDRNSLATCVSLCGWGPSGPSAGGRGQPDAVPAFFRECVLRWQIQRGEEPPLKRRTT